MHLSLCSSPHRKTAQEPVKAPAMESLSLPWPDGEQRWDDYRAWVTTMNSPHFSMAYISIIYLIYYEGTSHPEMDDASSNFGLKEERDDSVFVDDTVFFPF